MSGRFDQARRDGTYRPGTVVPAQAVAGLSAWGGGYQSGGPAPQLFDPFGKPLPPTAFHSPLDSAPGQPLSPRFTDPMRPPREFQGAPGFNLIPTPRVDEGATSFADLRLLAMSCPYLMTAFNYRKKQIRGVRWKINPIEEKTKSARDKHGDAIQAVTDFWKKPNRMDGLRFGEFMVQATEEILVTDGLVFWKHPTLDGTGLHSLVQIDGATIKLLVDEFWHVAGYQQVLYGYPATQYRTQPADVLRTAEELEGRILYLQSNPTVETTYGRTIVEELRPLIETAILRQFKQRAFYTKGTTPEGFVMLPEGEMWNNPDVIAKARRYFQDEWSNETMRAGMGVLPGGSQYVPTKPFNYTKDEEEQMISTICAATGVPRSIFVAQVNRASAEQNSDDMNDVGFRPLLQFHKDWIDDVIQNDLGAPELEIDFEAERAGNELAVAQAVALYVQAGILTVDEAREEKGLDPLPEEEKAPAKAVAMAQAMQAAGGKKPGEPGQDEAKPGEKNAPPPPAEKPPADAAAAKSELAAWEKFARRRLEKGRHASPFTVNRLPGAVADVVVRGLKTARTDTDVRGVFSTARVELAKNDSRAHAIHQVKHVVRSMFDREKAALLEHAARRLKRSAA